MCIKSIVLKSLQGVRSHAAFMLVAAGTALVVSAPAPALAQTASVCGPEIKEEVVKALAGLENAKPEEKAGLEAELYAKYQYCAQDSQVVSSSFVAAARECGAIVSNLGSLFYEEMSCVGYDPQRRQFAAPIKIKQTFGFGGVPLPGSREHVLHCVADAFGNLLPVGHDSVHLANALPNQPPTWQFAVITNANINLQTIQPMNNTTRRAKSILSWAFTPTNCNFTPIWGNALNYRIRLDQ